MVTLRTIQTDHKKRKILKILSQLPYADQEHLHHLANIMSKQGRSKAITKAVEKLIKILDNSSQ